MDFLTKLINFIKVKVTGDSSTSPVTPTSSAKKPIFNGKAKSEHPNEIPMMSEISDEQIKTDSTRSKYITTVKNPDYKVAKGDNIEKIAKKFGIETRSLLQANNLTQATAKKLQLGQILKIPPTRKIKGVRNLNDIAKSMGVSVDFIKKLKRVEDDQNLSENQFHNTRYKDKAGVLTIGIGHVWKAGEPTELSNAQVCELCAKDLLKMEDNLCAVLGGKKNYDKLPQSLKEALLDMTFNKGTAIIEDTPGLLYCLKSGKYEAAINKFTYNKSTTTGKEMSGLSKRRLFDISIATKMYKGNIPQSNLNTAQQVYNRGIELLRKEYPTRSDFLAMLAGYNNDVKSYFGEGKIKLITK